MKIVSLAGSGKVLIEADRLEVSYLTGIHIYNPDGYGSSGTKLSELVNHSFELERLKESIATAEAVKYKAKKVIESLKSIDDFKKALNESVFPFLDTYENK